MLANAPSQAPSSSDPIAELIRSGQSAEAIARCVELHGRALGTLCMALLGSQADAEEAVQETLLAAHAALATYRGDGSVRAWLFGIARRQCARQYETSRRQQRHLSVVPSPAGAAPTPELSLAELQRARSVRSALAALKPSEREALVLRYQAELSFREIADICGIDEATARKRASRGLQSLRKTLPVEEIR